MRFRFKNGDSSALECVLVCVMKAIVSAFLHRLSKSHSQHQVPMQAPRTPSLTRHF